MSLPKNRKLNVSEVDALLHEQNLVRLGDYEGAGKPIICRCNGCGQEVSPRISSIKSGHGGCKWCAAKARAQKLMIPAETAEAILRDAGAEPLEVFQGTKTNWKSQCLRCGEVIYPNLNNIQSGHTPCKYCAGKALTETKAKSIYLQAGARPIGSFPGVRENWQGKCLFCGKSVSPRLGDLQRGQGACRDCGYKKSAASQKLTEEIAVSRMIEAGAEPLEDWSDKKSSEDPWLCKCLTCGMVITPTLHSVSNGQGPCVFCGRKSAAQKTSLDPKVAADEMRSNGFEPLETYPGAAVPWLTKCKTCGSEKHRRLGNVKTGHGCQECAYSNARLDPKLAIEAMRNRGFEAIEPFPGANLPWLCKCLKCGQSSKKRLYSLSSTTLKGCTHCSLRELGSTVYLIKNQAYGAYKIGVGKQRRIEDHTSKSWEVVSTWECGDALSAYKLESEVLNYVREILKLPAYLGKPEMPQGGHTETFSSHDMTDLEMCHLVAKLFPSE